ncbi:Laccase domain protein yfiH [Comamonas aquatica]|uniref:Purine nucleoside phosphorylase n=1 Tax=Comamonas aquatica TaxID=225991 RepID=A0AA35D5Y3_9BURK|nr:Laccase domain protein yfiH [Comamonas aquatica]CAB5670516.1 Laccase domain protein yfiH [Comamonas aquatica]CAC9219084.1 Laccase domain protein yfiH [Comamonas aquatica]CAC9684381.1 Laccase domain protein yfiH [Comamonas aquatica]
MSSGADWTGYAACVTDTKHLLQQWLQPDWPAIPGVQALFTTRQGGMSAPPWDTMNLGDHVGDAPLAVAANRRLLGRVIQDAADRWVQPVFMQQVHGCGVQVLEEGVPQAQAFDACVTDQVGMVCTIMVADCLPVLMAHRSGRVVAAAHAGWRGLAGQEGHGVLEALWLAYARQLGLPADAALAAQTQVWLGPCIGPQAFEVGEDVRTAFTGRDAGAGPCFQARDGAPGKWMADLSGLARRRLAQLGLTQLYGNDGTAAWCTFSDASRFFSHRRDAGVLGSTGRMAACIWKTG